MGRVFRWLTVASTFLCVLVLALWLRAQFVRDSIDLPSASWAFSLRTDPSGMEAGLSACKEGLMQRADWSIGRPVKLEFDVDYGSPESWRLPFPRMGGHNGTCFCGDPSHSFWFHWSTAALLTAILPLIAFVRWYLPGLRAWRAARARELRTQRRPAPHPLRLAAGLFGRLAAFVTLPLLGVGLILLWLRSTTTWDEVVSCDAGGCLCAHLEGGDLWLARNTEPGDAHWLHETGVAGEWHQPWLWSVAHGVPDGWSDRRAAGLQWTRNTVRGYNDEVVDVTLVRLPLGALVVAALLPLAIAVARHLLAVRRVWALYPRGCCPHCGYDLRHTLGRRCPECGTWVLRKGPVPA